MVKDLDKARAAYSLLGEFLSVQSDDIDLTPVEPIDDGLHRPLEHATLFFRFDPRKPLVGDMQDLVSIGWSYPDRLSASPMLRQRNPKAKHLAYTVLTHFTRYEGLAWMEWADRNGINREAAFFHAAEEGLTHSRHWNHSHALSPHRFRAIYIERKDGSFRWISNREESIDMTDGDKLWLGRVDPFSEITLGSGTVSVQSRKDQQPGVFHEDRYLYWCTLTKDAVNNRSVKAIDYRDMGYRIVPGTGWESRIDRKDGGPGDWLMNVSNDSYRKFCIEDRANYLHETYREHRVSDVLTKKEFDGIYFDDCTLDLIDLEKRGGTHEPLSMKKYHEDCASLVNEIWEKVNDEQGPSYVCCNVGNWKFKHLQHFTKTMPHIYLDRMVNPQTVTGEKIAELEDTLFAIESQSDGKATVVIDGPGTDANCLSEDAKRLFLAIYYLVVPDTQRYMLALLFNGDHVNRSDWGNRHWINDILLPIGRPRGRMIISPEGIWREFTKGEVAVSYDSQGNLCGHIDTSVRIGEN